MCALFSPQILQAGAVKGLKWHSWMQESFWWWQCSDRYIISLFPHLHTSPLTPSLISLIVSVDVKYHVYLTPTGVGNDDVSNNQLWCMVCVIPAAYWRFSGWGCRCYYCKGPFIVGGSCHKHHFCRDKLVFVVTKHDFCRDKSMLAARKRLSRET